MARINKVTQKELDRIKPLKMLQFEERSGGVWRLLTFIRVGANKWKHSEQTYFAHGKEKPILFRMDHSGFKYLTRGKSEYYTDNAVARALRKFEEYKKSSGSTIRVRTA